MKILKNYYLMLLLLIGGAFISCSDDEDDMDQDFTGNFITYQLQEKSDSGINGTIRFDERQDNAVVATINLNNVTAGDHPAHIHANSAAESGDIIVSLNNVDANGESVTVITEYDNGTVFSYSDLLAANAYVNVHQSQSNLSTIVAQADIGGNALTGESISYDLDERAIEGISGNITFYERLNGFALARIMLENTPDGGMHPAHIHMNTAAEGGDILFTFNPVDGTTGISETTVKTFDDGESFEYLDVVAVDGYVNVHLSANELGTIVAQGDIGENVLTGESVSYDLEERAVAGISGMITFYERLDGTALATIMLQGTPDGGMHPAHIHRNSASEGGDIVFTFNPVDGSTGLSRTNIETLDDGSVFNYDNIPNYDGYVNVHLSAEDLATIVAQGNIGIND